MIIVSECAFKRRIRRAFSSPALPSDKTDPGDIA
jgi:hypothetical protein